MNTPVTQTLPGQQALPLADIIQPDPVGLWPLAPGWWLLLLIAVAMSAFLVILLKRYLQARRIRSQAFTLLDDARRVYEDTAEDESQSSASSNYCRDVNQALKRYWRHYNPAPDILISDGDAWIALLNRVTHTPIFDEKVAGALSQGPYRKIARLNPDVIDSAARQWLKQASPRTLSRCPGHSTASTGGPSHA